MIRPRPSYSVSGLLVPVEFPCSSVGLSVGPSLTSVYCGKTADSIEMAFAVMVGWVQGIMC